MKKNRIYLDFCIWDFNDIAHNEITNLLGISPCKIYIKNEPINPKRQMHKATQNGWRMTTSLDEYASFEDQMNAMLDIIESKIERFKPICEKYDCEFSCVMYIYYNNEESIPSLHLDTRYNKLINLLNIEFDLDMYYL